MPPECFLLQNLADEEVWKFLEGNVPKDAETSVRKHLVWCQECLAFYASTTQRLKETDPTRYRIIQSETLSIRKAELIRFAKSKGIELDVSKIREPEDFVKVALATVMGSFGPKFLELWEKMSPGQKDEMMVAALRILDSSKDGG